MWPGHLVPNRQVSREVVSPILSLLIRNLSLPLVLSQPDKVNVPTLLTLKCLPDLGARALNRLFLSQDGFQSHMGWQHLIGCFPNDPGNHRGIIFLLTYSPTTMSIWWRK